MRFTADLGKGPQQFAFDPGEANGDAKTVEQNRKLARELYNSVIDDKKGTKMRDLPAVKAAWHQYLDRIPHDNSTTELRGFSIYTHLWYNSINAESDMFLEQTGSSLLRSGDDICENNEKG